MTWPPPESLVDVVVGGLIAAIGGFLAVLFVRWRDRVAEEQRFKAAVLIVLDELGANEVNIEHLIGKPFGPAEFYDETYRSVELVLASRLKPSDRQLLAEAYAPLRAQWRTEQEGSPVDRAAMKKLGWIMPNKEALEAALVKVKAARTTLARYVPQSQTMVAVQLDGDASTGPPRSGGIGTKQT